MGYFGYLWIVALRQLIKASQILSLSGGDAGILECGLSMEYA